MTSTLLAARVLLAGHLARTRRTLRGRGEDGVSTLELVIIVLGLFLPIVAVGCYVLVALFLLFPFHRLRRAHQ